MRAFIAIELPGFVRTALAGVQGALGWKLKGVRWVAPDNIHLTLVFLGDVSTDFIGHVYSVLDEIGKNTATFSLSAKGLGAFPGLGRPRVIWTGLGGDIGRLVELHRNLRDQLKKIGFEGENRKFSGHLTLGRAKETLDAVCLVDCIREFKDFATEPFAATRVDLMKSDLKSTGPVYTKIFQSSFAGA